MKVKSELEQNGIKVVVLGSGDKIVKQSILPNVQIASGERIILTTNDTLNKMIDITGWSRKEAQTLFDYLNLNCLEK